MKLSLSIVSVLFATSLAMSIKRQNNNTPACIDGDTSESSGPYQGCKWKALC